MYFSVVKEEFARHTDSPDQTSTDDSNQSAFPSPYYDPMMWSGPLAGDLEMDAAPHSLRPSVHSTVTHLSKGLVSSLDLSSVSSKYASCNKPQQGNSPPSSSVSSRGSFQPDSSIGTQAGRKEKANNVAVTPNISGTSLTVDDVVLERADSVLSSTNVSMTQEGEVNEIPLSPTSTMSVTDISSKKERNSSIDTASLTTKTSEPPISEGVRTDEGFSEVSEETSMRDEGMPRKAESELGYMTEPNRQGDHISSKTLHL